jgi:DNA-binding CsgD family transcriptional regulator
VLAHRGLLIRSADLYRTLGPSAAVLAVPALVVTGALDEARAAAGGGPGSAGLLDGAAALMARGMLATVDGAGPSALSQLAQAAVLLEPVAATTLLPDTPAALTAVVALQCGEPAIAGEAVRRALAHRHGGRAAQARHRLLHGWVQLRRGRAELARRALGTAPEPEPRDELLAAALAVALARRADDPAALATAWGRARGALVRQPVDLTTLIQLGELAVATAYLGEEAWLTAHLDEADALLERLGRPPLWSGPLHWYRLQAALVAGRDDEADRHTEALRAAPDTPHAAVLAAAATCWRDVRAGQVDAEEVVAIGRRMSAVGLGWEGAQLAGRAALLAGDRRAAAGLHAAARALHAVGPAAENDGPAVEPEVAPGPEEAAGPSPDGERGGFTERELEIGRHILAGLTYKQIGGRLFLSAKTVEHHVARMRQRSGAGSRDELFGLVRAALETQRAG